MKFFVIVAFAVLFSESPALKLIKKGDALFSKRENPENVKKAIKFYEQALAIDPSLTSGYWKIAKSYYWLGWLEKSKDKKLKYFKEGIEYAKLCVENDPKVAECHFWLGVSYGKYGEAKGVLQSLHLIPYIKKEMLTVIKLDPKLESGGAYRVLGRLYFKLPSFKGGSNEKSVEYLKKAIKVAPDNLMNYRFLAETYYSMGKKDEAILLLEKVIKMPAEKGREPESRIEKAKAKKLLEKYKG